MFKRSWPSIFPNDSNPYWAYKHQQSSQDKKKKKEKKRRKRKEYIIEVQMRKSKRNQKHAFQNFQKDRRPPYSIPRFLFFSHKQNRPEEMWGKKKKREKKKEKKTKPPIHYCAGDPTLLHYCYRCCCC